jgi:hypothetical protein
MFATTTAARFPTIGGDSKEWEVPGNPAANRRASRLLLRATIKLGPQTTKPHDCGSGAALLSPQVCFGLPNPVTLYRRDTISVALLIAVCKVFQFFQLNEIDDLREIYHNGVTSTHGASRHPLCFEAHTMTAEALSPPDPMNALRDQLIQNGSVVPSTNADQQRVQGIGIAIGSTREKVLKVIESIEKFKSISEFSRAIDRCFSGISISDFFQKSCCSYSDLLRFLNLHRVLENLIKRREKSSDEASIVRTGFFFAFKENMRNTP